MIAVSSAVLIPAVGLVLVAVVGALERLTLRRRNRGMDELEQAWTHRGELVTAMRERLEWEAQRGDRCDERLAVTQARLERVEKSVGITPDDVPPPLPPLPPPPPLPPLLPGTVTASEVPNLPATLDPTELPHG